MNKNLLEGFKDIDKDFKDLGSLFNNGFRNLTRVTDDISKEIARGNAEITGKIEELAAALQGIESQFKGEVPLQNSSSSSTLPSFKNTPSFGSAGQPFAPYDPSIYAERPKTDPWDQFLDFIYGHLGPQDNPTIVKY